MSGGNDFLCRTVNAWPGAVKSTVSHGERQLYDSDTCPEGRYIRGMNIEENRFLCSEQPADTLSADVSPVYRDLKCGADQVAVGFNRREQKILCSSFKPV